MLWSVGPGCPQCWHEKRRQQGHGRDAASKFSLHVASKKHAGSEVKALIVALGYRSLMMGWVIVCLFRLRLCVMHRRLLVM
jgi:hypothetical protein